MKSEYAVRTSSSIWRDWSIQVGLGFFVKRLGLDDFAMRQHAVKNVPLSCAPAFQPLMSWSSVTGGVNCALFQP